MANRREDPMGELLLLQQRMNRLFEESLTSEAGSGPGGSWIPAADLWETGDGFVLELELPGIDAADVDVKVTREEVAIRGNRRDPRTGETPERFQCLERSYGPFARRFALTAQMDGSGTRHTLDDGVLRVEIPKRSGGRGG